ncbi:MAG: polyhydroxyalkanoic acid system family protein [Candidatus Kapabacteria bacterium]|nr:polyhydroxyalkanoic acid system family protein [Candidatus Kapabacteria bacterium]
MATIHQTIDTNKSIVEMRTALDTKVLSRPELRILLDDHHWEGNVLHAKGKMGHGTITLEDKKVIVHIELSIFGSAAKGAIESALADQIKRLSE